jgi:hypothetical protein
MSVVNGPSITFTGGCSRPCHRRARYAAARPGAFRRRARSAAVRLQATCGWNRLAEKHFELLEQVGTAKL